MVLGGFGEGFGRVWEPFGRSGGLPRLFFSCFGTFLGCLAIFSMFLVNFWLFLLFLVTLGCCGMFLLNVACWAWFFNCVGRAKRASKASERSSLVLALGFPCLPMPSLAYPCFVLCRFLCSTMVCLLSLLSLALPCVTCFNSPKTISLLLLHASTTLICLRASRSLAKTGSS